MADPDKKAAADESQSDAQPESRSKRVDRTTPDQRREIGNRLAEQAVRNRTPIR